MAEVFIPHALRPATGGTERVRVEGDTLGQVIERLEELYPGFKQRVLSNGAVKPGMAVICDHYPARLGLREPVGKDTELHFVSAIAGG